MRKDSPVTNTIIKEIHSTTHRGYHKSLHQICTIFLWLGMRSHIKNFIKHCDTCQHHRSENTSPAGLLHPLPIPMQAWANISMNFIDELLASKWKDTIYVVVDRLSKYAHLSQYHIHTWQFLWLIYFLIKSSSYMGCHSALFVTVTLLSLAPFGRKFSD